MIPTAEQFLIDFYTPIYDEHPESFKSKLSLEAYLRLYINGRINGKEDNLPELLAKFARIHAIEALKQASNEAFIDDFTQTINRDSILNAYPLENIK